MFSLLPLSNWIIVEDSRSFRLTSLSEPERAWLVLTRWEVCGVTAMSSAQPVKGATSESPSRGRPARTADLVLGDFAKPSPLFGNPQWTCQGPGAEIEQLAQGHRVEQVPRVPCLDSQGRPHMLKGPWYLSFRPTILHLGYSCAAKPLAYMGNRKSTGVGSPEFSI